MMKAAVLQGLGNLQIKALPVPDVKPGGMLIKIEVCAVCGSDLRIFESGNDRVKFPAIIGHEIAGEIVALGAGVNNYQIGAKVAIGADVPCGSCSWCKGGMGNCCDENYAMGYQFAGGFAQYCFLDPMVVQHGPIAKIPETVPLEDAALAEPLGCCLNGLERASFNASKSVLVMGAGPIGLMLVQLARALGSSLTIITDTNPLRLQQAALAGPDHVIQGGKNDLEAEIKHLTRGRGVDIVLVACPSVEAQEQSVALVAKRGVVNFFGGLPSGTRNINISSNQVHYREISLTGSHGSVPSHHKQALELISQRRIEISKMITHRFGLDQILEAFDTVKQKKGLKVVVKPWA